MLHRSIALLAASFLCLAVPASLAEGPALSSGAFNVLSISVDGLPPILDPSGPSADVKKMKTMYIGMLMALYSYGIINVQEDYDYHETLYQYDKHQFRTATSGDAPSGSGLNTLSKYNWVDFARIDWNLCSNTCLTRQGFTFMRVRIDVGVYIDMINLDTNAGTDSEFGDQLGRRSNIKQVSDFIKHYSGGNPVIVFGNTNSNYTRVDDNIRILSAENGLTDAWVEATGGKAPELCGHTNACPKGIPRDINCESLDKVLYRGSPSVNITSLGFYYDTSRFSSPEGNALTNRNPIRVEFQWDLISGLRQSDLYGGPHGHWFNDIRSIPSCPKLSSIHLRGGNRLDGLTLTLTSGLNLTHGGSGGTASILNIASGEHITSVKLCWGKRLGHTRIFYAQATTNKLSVIQAGQLTNSCATAVAPSGYGVVGTYGRDGDEMDQLGLIYAEQREDSGCPEGNLM